MNKKFIASLMLALSLSILGAGLVTNLGITEGNATASLLVKPNAETPPLWLD